MKPLYQPVVYKDMIQRSALWHHWRDSGVGGSESAYVMHVAYRGDVNDLWESKLHLVPEFTPNAAMLRGQALEDDARIEFSLHTGLPMNPICLEHPVYPFIKASLDGISDDGNVITEIKCPGWKTHSEALEGKIRPYYYCQMQHQLLASGARLCLYWSYTDTFKDEARAFKLIEVPRDEPYIARLQQRLQLFWPCIENEIPPDKDLFWVKDAGILNGDTRSDPLWINVTNELKEYKISLETETDPVILSDLQLQYDARLQAAENLMQRRKQITAKGNGVRLTKILDGSIWKTELTLIP